MLAPRQRSYVTALILFVFCKLPRWHGLSTHFVHLWAPKRAGFIQAFYRHVGRQDGKEYVATSASFTICWLCSHFAHIWPPKPEGNLAILVFPMPWVPQDGKCCVATLTLSIFRGPRRRHFVCGFMGDVAVLPTCAPPS